MCIEPNTPSRPRMAYFTPSQCEYFDHSARRILIEKGWRVESRRLRKDLEDRGCVHRDAEQIVAPSAEIIDTYLSELKARGFQRDSMHFHAGGYPTHYVDHRDGMLKRHTRNSALELMTVGEKLPVVDHVSVPGTMWDVPLHVRPFHTKLLIWEYGRKTTGSFEFTRPDEYPFLRELTRRYAEIKKAEIKDLLIGSVYREYPLVFGKDTCELFYCFRDEGFRCGFNNAYPMMGLQAPATLSGAVLSTLLDCLTTGLFAYLYDHELRMTISVPGVLDLSTALPRRSVPESLMLLMGLGSMADYYGANVLQYIDGFRSQAKAVMSFQNGAERIGHLIAAYLCGATHLSAMGSLSEPGAISSLAQLVLDAEMARQLRYCLRGYEISDDRAAVPVFLSDQHKSNFIHEDHTMRFMREEMYLNSLFVGGIKFEQFLSEAMPDEHTRACRTVNELLKEPLSANLTPSEKDYLLEVIRGAEKKLA